MDQGCGLQQMAGPLAPQLSGGDLVQLAVDQGNGLFACRVVSTLHLREQQGKVLRLLCLGSGGTHFGKYTAKAAGRSS
jgi:hypothetical protein